MVKIILFLTALTLTGCGGGSNEDDPSTTDSVMNALVVDEWASNQALCGTGKVRGRKARVPQKQIDLRVTTQDYTWIEKWEDCTVTTRHEIMERRPLTASLGLKETAALKSKKRSIRCSGKCDEITIERDGKTFTFPACEEKSNLTEDSELVYQIDDREALRVSITSAIFSDVFDEWMSAANCGTPVLEFNRR